MLKLIRYNTMNSWNNSTAPAFNLKVYNVIPIELQNKVYEIQETDEYWEEVNNLIFDFQNKHNYTWQAGFNGRSGGYLVLYQGGIGLGGKVYCYPGRGIETKDVPKEILKSFSQLARNIVKYTISTCKNNKVVTKEIKVPKKIKVMQRI